MLEYDEELDQNYTSMPEQDLVHCGMQEQGNSTRISILQKISSSVPVALVVKDGASNFSPSNVIISEAIVRLHPNFQQSIPNS